MGLSFFPCLPEKLCLHCHRLYVLVKFNPVQSVATSVAISFCLSGSTPGHHLWALSNGLTHIFFTHNYSRSASQPANEGATLPPLNGLDYCKRNQNLNVELWHCIVCLNKWYYHNQEMLYSGHQAHQANWILRQYTATAEGEGEVPANNLQRCANTLERSSPHPPPKKRNHSER